MDGEKNGRGWVREKKWDKKERSIEYKGEDGETKGKEEKEKGPKKAMFEIMKRERLEIGQSSRSELMKRKKKGRKDKKNPQEQEEA